jgi:hypothetical protein
MYFAYPPLPRYIHNMLWITTSSNLSVPYLVFLFETEDFIDHLLSVAVSLEVSSDSADEGESH